MGRHRTNYPLTSYLLTQSWLGVIIRMCDTKALLGRMEPYIQRCIVVETVTFLEQFLRLIAERWAAGGRGRSFVRAKDIGARVSVKKARVSAVRMIYQSKGSVEWLARNRRIGPLLDWLRAGGGKRLSYMYDVRHALAHSVGIVRFDAARVFRTAESLVHALLAGRPREAVACRLVEGARLGAAGLAAGARRAYRAALELCDGQPSGGKKGAWVHTSRGHALARLGRLAEAEASYRKAAKADPSSALICLELANLLALDGRPEDAREWYEKSISNDPRYVPARMYRGHAYLMRPGASGALAVECYEETLRLSAEEMSAHTGLGLCHAREGRYEEAAARFREASRLDPADPAPYTGLANALAAQGRYGEAIGLHCKAARIAALAGLEAAALHRESAGEEGAPRRTPLRRSWASRPRTGVWQARCSRSAA